MWSLPMLNVVLFVVACRYAAAIEQPTAALSSIQYIFRVTTCNITATSSNSTISVKFKGTNKTTDYMPLEQTDRKPVIHSSGEYKTYMLTGTDVGPLNKLLILTEQDDHWCLQSPKVTIPAHSNVYHFTDALTLSKSVTYSAVKKVERILLHRPALQVPGPQAVISDSSVTPPGPVTRGDNLYHISSTVSSFDTLSYILIIGAVLLVLLGCAVLCCVYCNERKKLGDEATMTVTSTAFSASTQGRGVDKGEGPPGKAPPAQPPKPVQQDEAMKSPKSKTANKSLSPPEDSERQNKDAKEHNEKGKKRKEPPSTMKKERAHAAKKKGVGREKNKSPPPTTAAAASYVPLATPTADDMQTAQDY